MDHEMTDETISQKNNKTQLSLRDYLKQYSLNQKFMRIISIIDRAYQSKVDN